MSQREANEGSTLTVRLLSRRAAARHVGRERDLAQRGADALGERAARLA